MDRRDYGAVGHAPVLVRQTRELLAHLIGQGEAPLGRQQARQVQDQRPRLRHAGL